MRLKAFTAPGGDVAVEQLAAGSAWASVLASRTPTVTPTKVSTQAINRSLSARDMRIVEVKTGILVRALTEITEGHY